MKCCSDAWGAAYPKALLSPFSSVSLRQLGEWRKAGDDAGRKAGGQPGRRAPGATLRSRADRAAEACQVEVSRRQIVELLVAAVERGWAEAFLCGTHLCPSFMTAARR